MLNVFLLSVSSLTFGDIAGHWDGSKCTKSDECEKIVCSFIYKTKDTLICNLWLDSSTKSFTNLDNSYFASMELTQTNSNSFDFRWKNSIRQIYIQNNVGYSDKTRKTLTQTNSSSDSLIHKIIISKKDIYLNYLDNDQNISIHINKIANLGISQKERSQNLLYLLIGIILGLIGFALIVYNTIVQSFDH